MIAVSSVTSQRDDFSGIHHMSSKEGKNPIDGDSVVGKLGAKEFCQILGLMSI